jgi:hypothetical protein
MVIGFAALRHCNIVIELDFEGEFQFHEMLQIDPCLKLMPHSPQTVNLTTGSEGELLGRVVDGAVK